MTVHDDDILDFDFVDDETREIARRRASRRHGRRSRGGPRGGGGPRRPQLRAPHGITPLLRLVGLVAFAIVVVVLLAVWVQGCAAEDNADDLRRLPDRRRRASAQDSAKIGAELATLLTTPGSQAGRARDEARRPDPAAAARRRARTRPRPARPADARPRERGRGARAPRHGPAGPARRLQGDEGHTRTQQLRAGSSRPTARGSRRATSSGGTSSRALPRRR